VISEEKADRLLEAMQRIRNFIKEHPPKGYRELREYQKVEEAWKIIRNTLFKLEVA